MRSHEDLVRKEREMLVLLYEFPAETRLTVYRRLDICSFIWFSEMLSFVDGGFQVACGDPSTKACIFQPPSCSVCSVFPPCPVVSLA